MCARVNTQTRDFTTYRNEVLRLRNLVVDGLVVVQLVPQLRDQAQLHRRPQLDGPRVGRDFPCQHVEERCLAAAVGPDDADDGAGLLLLVVVLLRERRGGGKGRTEGRKGGVSQPEREC